MHGLQETESIYLANCKKNVYLSHHRFVSKHDTLRKKGKHFNGKADHQEKPKERTGVDVFDRVKDIEVIFGKGLGG
jgi:hypothetical protein